MSFPRVTLVENSESQKDRHLTLPGHERVVHPLLTTLIGALKAQLFVSFPGIVEEKWASTHVSIEFGQGEGNAGFGKIEDGVRPGEGFPPEARAVLAVQGEEGGFRFREDVGSQGGNGEVVAEFLDSVVAEGGTGGSMFVILAARVLVGRFLLSRGVIASTRVFAQFAFRAGGHVEVEFRGDGLGIGRGFDLENDGKLLAFRNHLVGDELVAVLGEGELGRVRAIPHDDGDDLRRGRDDLARIIEEADFCFLVLGHDELGFGCDRVDDAAAVRGFDFFRRGGEGEAGDEGGDGGYFGFHGVVWFGD